MKPAFTKAVAICLFFACTNFNSNRHAPARTPPEAYSVLTIRIPNSCIPKLASCCGLPASSPVVVGGGGKGNVKGRDVLEYLFYQSLDDNRKAAFKASSFSSDVVKSPARFNELNNLYSGDMLYLGDKMIRADQLNQRMNMQLQHGGQ